MRLSLCSLLVASPGTLPRIESPRHLPPVGGLVNTRPDDGVGRAEDRMRRLGMQPHAEENESQSEWSMVMNRVTSINDYAEGESIRRPRTLSDREGDRFPVKRVRFGNTERGLRIYVEELEIQDGKSVTPDEIAQFIVDLDAACNAAAKAKQEKDK